MDAAANSYRRFLDGDESAFEEIMQELFCGLVFFINGFVHDPHAAEDIAIDAFSDLVVHRQRYGPDPGAECGALRSPGSGGRR